MEWPPDKERLKRDLYMAVGGAAVMFADLGILLVENPHGAARVAVLTTGAAGGFVGALRANNMVSSNYEFDDQSSIES